MNSSQTIDKMSRKCQIEMSAQTVRPACRGTWTVSASGEKTQDEPPVE